VPYKGRETRVFAHYGMPYSASDEEKAPAIILVHGGAGTAFPEWVKQWTNRGYAAIAMDLEGQNPLGSEPDDDRDGWPSHAWSGPVKQGVFADYREPVEDQWMYHAVAAVVLAHSLIRSLPGVDHDRIGMMGISWGGIITSLVAGIDLRLSFAMTIYGCGFLYEPGTFYGRGFAAMGDVDAERIRQLWDPSEYLAQSNLPMLWLNSSNDTHFPLSIFNKSFELHRQCEPDKSMLSLHHALGHSYAAAWACAEPFAFADSVTKGEPQPIQIRGAKQLEDWVIVEYASSLPVVKACLYWSADDRDWRNARWEPVAAQLLAEHDRAHADAHAYASLPQRGGTFFMNITNDRGWTTSTCVMRDNRTS